MSYTRNTRGFSIMELLVSLGIIAVLIGATAIFFNPVEYLRRARDSERVEDMSMLATQIAAQRYSGKRFSFGAANTIYISLGDTSTTCANLTLPTPPVGWQYHCVLTADLGNTDGTGWIPVDFAGYKIGSSLPLDPLNTTSSFYEAAFNSGGKFILRAVLESQKNRESIATKDSGTDDTKYETGTATSLDELYE